jgi:hypothetical protein
MDGNRFDDLIKAFTSRQSRRSILKGITGSLAGLAVGLAGRGRSFQLGGGSVAAQAVCKLTCPANIA